MKYSNIQPGVFIVRPNRFIAQEEIEGWIEVCHVNNTGRPTVKRSPSRPLPAC